MASAVRHGSRTYYLLVPVSVAGAEVASVTFRPFVYGDFEDWEAGRIDGPNGMMSALWCRLSGLTHAHMRAMQYPDTDLCMAEFMQHLPRSLTEAMARGEYPAPAEPSSQMAQQDEDTGWVQPGEAPPPPAEDFAPASFDLSPKPFPSYAPGNPTLPKAPASAETRQAAPVPPAPVAPAPSPTPPPVAGQRATLPPREPIYNPPPGYMPSPLSDEERARMPGQRRDLALGVDLDGDQRDGT